MIGAHPSFKALSAPCKEIVFLLHQNETGLKHGDIGMSVFNTYPTGNNRSRRNDGNGNSVLVFLYGTFAGLLVGSSEAFYLTLVFAFCCFVNALGV